MKVEYGQGKAQIVSVKARRKNGDNIKVMMVYIPHRTNKWSAHILEEMLCDTLNSMK